jgi:molybdopterin-guanine dinucleotide biosynthesis protein A
LSSAADGRAGAIAVACSGGRRHPVFALWSSSQRPSIARALGQGERKVSSFLDEHGCVEVQFPMARWGDHAVDPFFNINTPQDLAEAERLMGSEIR